MLNYKTFKDNGLTLNRVEKINNVYLINTKNKRYIVKELQHDLNQKFEYLSSRNFNYFPNHFTLDKYDIYKYIEDKNISNEERLNEIINLISLLHAKTTRYKKINIDDYKIIYENITEKLNKVEEYYISLNNQIDNEIYMSPSLYLLALNISKIYNAIAFSKYELDNWYEIVKNNEKERLAFIHNNLSLEHLLYNENPYLISWNKSRIDIPIYDLINLYKKYYNEIDFKVLLTTYQKRYPLNTEELKLFFIMISIPNKINFTNDEYENVIKVKETIEYLNESDKLIKPYYTQKKDIKI